MQPNPHVLTKKQVSELSIQILKHYRNNVEIILPALHQRESSVYISEKALKMALNCSIDDINIFLNRRKPKRFISRGKIAGIILYRLSRNHIIHTSNSELLKDPIFLGLNSLIAILVALNYIEISYKSLPEFNKLELIYSLNKRHINQETLGLVFDYLCSDSHQH